MLVVVLLREPNVYTVIPEECIYSLNPKKDEKQLKNRGINQNRDRLIFFSNDIYDKISRNCEEKFQPKFYLPVTSSYPLPNNLNETCFIGRTYCFESEFK